MQSVQLQWLDIREYIVEEAARDMKRGMSLAGKEGAKYLRSNSPVSKDAPRRGKYARGWRSTIEGGAGRTGEVYIYNQTDWQLTHLLEDGHSTLNRFGGKGYAAGDGHISRAEGYVESILERSLRVSRGLY